MQSKRPNNGRGLGEGSPERRVLLACLRDDSCSDVADERRAALSDPGIDFGRLLDLAQIHRVFPLLFAAISRDAADLVPADWLGELRGLAHSNALRSRFIATETARLLALAAERNLPVLAYKGSVLASMAYADPDLRAVGDIDLLIRQEDRGRFQEMLLGADYETGDEPEVREHFNLEPVRRIEELYLRETPVLTYALDVHWMMFRRFWPVPLSLETVLHRARSREFEGQTIQTASPEDLLLILAAHGTKHLWSRLAWLVDIDRLIRSHPELETGAIVARARGLGVARLLAVTLSMLRELLDTPIDANLQRLIDEDRDAVETLTAERLADLDRGAIDADVVLFHPFLYRVRERFADRSRYLRFWYLTRYLSLTWLRNAVRPNQFDREYVSLPPSLGGLYFLVRPVRVIHHRLARVLRRRTPEVGR